MSDLPNLDIDHVRGHFPALDDGWAYVDNAAGTLVPRSVIERMTAFMSESQVQPGSPYPASELASARLAEARRAVAGLINAEADEVVIGPSTTMNVYVLARAMRSLLAPGDEVVVTNLDHEANNGAWRHLAEDGMVVREWQLDPDTGELEIEALEALLTARTRLVCFTHCSNITGGFNDAAAIVRRVHAAGAMACIDGVAFGPHAAIDVKAIDADFYLCSLYKIYGPHQALLYAKRAHFLALAGQSHFFIAEDDLPLKLTVGGYGYEAVGALTGIVDYLEALHAHHFTASNLDLRGRLDQVYALFAAHEAALVAPLMDLLVAKPAVRLLGRPTANRARRAPTVSFVVRDIASAEVVRRLAGHRIGASNGNFYAWRAVRGLGIDPEDGVVRLSLVHYNRADEVERLVRALDDIIP